MFASEALLLEKSPDPGVELPRGFAAELPNKLGAVDEEVVAGFWACANNPPGCVFADWLFCWPNKDEPD